VNWVIPATAASELAAAFLQGAVTFALAALCAFLYHVYRKPYFLYWALAWSLYSLRLVAIVSFLITENPIWLFWHQVTTGWTALALLWAALVFAQRIRWRPAYVAFIAFPVVWSYIAIYRLDRFLLAAGPAVLFLSGATLLTAWAFLRHWRQTGSTAAAFLAGALLLWGLHHLDYPFLRERGVWNPWGYYLDLVFVLSMGLGILLLVVEDLNNGLRAISSLSAVLQPGARGDLLDDLLARMLTLPAVRGAAMALRTTEGARVVRAIGVCAPWEGKPLAGDAAVAFERAVRDERPGMVRVSANGRAAPRYVAALPVLEGDTVRGAILAAGNARDPFAALDLPFLTALGQQVGAALANAELYRRLKTRTASLERLAARMVRQHEDERRRLSRELHDETAQVFAAVNMQLGLVRERATAEQIPRLDRALGLVGEGIRGIRRVTEHLRPSLLDDLGLLPALRGLVDDFAEHHDIACTFDAPDALPALSDEAELALFRALQEALSNVARHANANTVAVALEADARHVTLHLHDDGHGAAAGVVTAAERAGRLGLAGMRERISALGGEMHVRTGDGPGFALVLVVPFGEIA
jgi:signal transduction histidine kinase